MSNYVGMHIGSYKLISLLGQGNYAQVYRAEHITLHQQVAIKVFNEILSSQQKQCFQEEVQVLQDMQHPHIIPILASGMTDKRPYIVMNYASHGSLRDRLTGRGRESLPVVVSYVKQLADALHYVHAHNFVHRDIKPENILFNTDGEALLSDFGIAIAPDETRRSAWKNDQNLVYMAPEQFEERASTHSDQYALAIIVYEWLTGQRPFLESPQERWVDWAQTYQHELSLAPPQLDPSVPLEVGQVILKALAKQPCDRYADVTTFAAALQLAAEQKQGKGKAHPIVWYKQRLEEYEQHFRTDELPEQEAPLAILIECLTKPYTQQALSHLSWMERSCLLLHIDAHFTPEEIATILNSEEACVLQHLERGRQLLLDTYDSLLEQEQGISPYKGPSHITENHSRVARLMHHSS